MSKPPDDFMQFLEAQRADYAAGLPKKVDDMERLIESIGSDPAVDLKTLERLAHSMAGSGGTFGFDAVGDAAKVLELSIERLRAASGAATEAHLQDVRTALRKLREALPGG
jgi:HPt (histidine-containing phosphotransfer) domain-containing protein